MDRVLGQTHEVRSFQGDQRVPEGSLEDFILCSYSYVCPWIMCHTETSSTHLTTNFFPHGQVNHFPGTFQIGRKDRLWRNLSKMQTRVGKKARNHSLRNDPGWGCIFHIHSLHNCTFHISNTILEEADHIITHP